MKRKVRRTVLARSAKLEQVMGSLSIMSSALKSPLVVLKVA